MSSRVSRLAAVGLMVFFLSGMEAAGFCQPPPPLPADNEAPIARLVWPQLWLTAEPVPFDATGSEDLDGLLDEFELIFGDGTDAQVNATGEFNHLYGAPGTYEFRLEVRDDTGAPSEIVGTVVVVDRLDMPVCDCELPCLEDAVCAQEGCFYTVAVQGVIPPVDGGSQTVVDPAPVPNPVTCAAPQP